MKTRTAADGSTMKLAQQILKKTHDGLKEAEVTFDILFVQGEEGAPSIKEGGYNTFGKVKIYNEDDRKRGNPDALLFIDQQVWETASVDEREGMLDHLLQQLEVRKTEKGEIIRDSTGRPKLNRRKYDLRLAGFSVVIERNGEHAPEAQAAKYLKDKWGQLLMWSEQPAAVG